MRWRYTLIIELLLLRSIILNFWAKFLQLISYIDYLVRSNTLFIYRLYRRLNTLLVGFVSLSTSNCMLGLKTNSTIQKRDALFLIIDHEIRFCLFARISIKSNWIDIAIRRRRQLWSILITNALILLLAI